MLILQIMAFFLFRLRTQLLCQTEEGHFPFDHQTCRLVMDNCKCSVFFRIAFHNTIVAKNIVLLAATCAMIKVNIFKNTAKKVVQFKMVNMHYKLA